jgi:hypothetical protein
MHFDADSSQVLIFDTYETHPVISINLRLTAISMLSPLSNLSTFSWVGDAITHLAEHGQKSWAYIGIRNTI